MQRFTALVLLLHVATLGQAFAQVIPASAADFRLGVPERGSIVALFCQGINVSETSLASGFPLPRQLQGIHVTIGGRVAPLYAVAQSGNNTVQINAQVPSETDFTGGVAINVYQGNTMISSLAAARGESPGEFFRLSGEDGIFLRANAGYSIVTSANPARAGDILVTYLTGLPLPTPRVNDGESAPTQPLSVLADYSNQASSQEIRLLANNTTIKPDFVGLAPGLAGVYQINFTLPALDTGLAEIKLSISICGALFGSCANGGGIRTRRLSTPVRLPVILTN